MPALEPAPVITLGGRPIRSETLVDSVGAWHVVLRTVIPDLGVELQSSYTGHDAADGSVAVHLVLTPQRQAVEPIQVANSRMPVWAGRRRCMYDHLQRLQDVLYELGLESVEVDVLDDALLAVDR